MIFSLTYFKHEKVGLNERRCKGGDKRDFYRKIMPVILFENCSAFGKICQTEILPISQKWSQKFIGMIFHALMLLYLTFWGEIFFGPKFGQVWPNLDQFLGPNFFSFRVKKAFVNMNWIPKCDIFISASSKVIQPCAFRPSKANVSLTLQPLKLPIGQNVPQTILYGFQVLFLTYL